MEFINLNGQLRLKVNLFTTNSFIALCYCINFLNTIIRSNFDLGYILLNWLYFCYIHFNFYFMVEKSFICLIIYFGHSILNYHFTFIKV